MVPEDDFSIELFDEVMSYELAAEYDFDDEFVYDNDRDYERYRDRDWDRVY